MIYVVKSEAADVAEHTEIDAEDGINDGAKQMSNEAAHHTASDAAPILGAACNTFHVKESAEDVPWIKHGSKLKRSHKPRSGKDTKAPGDIVYLMVIRSKEFLIVPYQLLELEVPVEFYDKEKPSKR